MGDSQASVETISPDSATTPRTPSRTVANLDSVLVLPTHLGDGELCEIEAEIRAAGGTTTKDITKAQLVLTAISSPRRARFELQVRGVDTTQLASKTLESPSSVDDVSSANGPKRKRRRTTLWSDESPMAMHGNQKASTRIGLQERVSKRLRVVRLDWLRTSMKEEAPAPIEPFIILEGPWGRSTGFDNTESGAFSENEKPRSPSSDDGAGPVAPKQLLLQTAESLVEAHGNPYEKTATIPVSGAGAAAHDSDQAHTLSPAASEDTGSETEASSPRPGDMPDWVTKKLKYACQRSTPPDSPNADFIDQLKKIRLVRTLIEDEVGVRAYSTSIAALAAFPRRLASPREVAALPGCDAKIARLFREFRQSGHIAAAGQLETDPALSVIAQFYDIWGVGARTAREFFYDRGWRSIDDVIEQGWTDLTRVQQIGLKYQDEFAVKIPRSEVEYIASVVTYHARRLVDEGVECIIVGGYRRGKAESGDVDLILSHRREEATAHLIRPLVHALERAGWVTHLLTLSEKNSAREQQTLPIRPRAAAGAGFDTLDKALVVWQDPTRADDLAVDSDAPNPNLHRRVELIVPPIIKNKSAVAGWTSGTTFQRDMRRYCKNVKGWKFDSSGARDRATGQWLDLERWSDEKTRAKTWQEAERRLFEGLGLVWREPWERVTD